MVATRIAPKSGALLKRSRSPWKANAEVPEDITAYGKSLGQIGHKMLTDGTDLVVIDEWPSGDAFNTFFAGATRMGEFLTGAGIVGEPDITMLDTLEVLGDVLMALRPTNRVGRYSNDSSRAAISR